LKQLIVNADDLGLTPAVNRGVVRAFQSGIVTSTSLLVTGSAFEDAVALARQNPELDVGLHLALVDGPVITQWRGVLAARDGALVPLVPTAEDMPIALWRLVAERALCVNTTAAGGNASLMTLSV